MRIPALILTTLTGCDELLKDDTGQYDTCYGSPMTPSDFEASGDFDAAALSSLLGRYGLTDPGDLTCEQLCTQLVEEEYFAAVNRIDTCTHSIETADDTAGESTATVSCSGQKTTYCEGRRPLGHVEADCADTLGGFLARCAHLEAASVVAFEQLARQLTGLGAPAELIERCLVAAEEERDHARAVTMLARRHGGRVPALAALPVAEDIETIARHNATEGCVAETWAALMACWKGKNAADATLRAAYARIAVDELRHAQLAWDLHAWLLDQLDDAARRRVEAAQADAIAALPDLAIAQVRQLPPALGMPSARQAAMMAERFREGLLAA
jgi:hypothetical protein